MDSCSSTQRFHQLQRVREEFSLFCSQEPCDFQFVKKCVASSINSSVLKQILKSLLKIKPAQREQWMVKAIVKLTKPIQFFKKYQNEHYDCAQVIESKRAVSGYEVVPYNSAPDYFYIIIEGEVVVYLKKTEQQLAADIAAKENDSDNEIPQDESAKLLSPRHLVKGIPRFKKVADFKEGKSFGQLGILYNKPRMALIVAKTQCLFGILSQSHYINIFSQNQKRQRKHKKQFIFDTLLTNFRDLKYELCQGILYSFTETRLIIDQVLFRQGDVFDGFYIIQHGQILLHKIVLPKETENSHILQTHHTKHYRKKLIARVSKGYLLCYNQLKKAIDKGVPGRYFYTATVSSSDFKAYRMSYKTMLKIFDYKNTFGSILKSFAHYNSQMQKVSLSLVNEEPMPEDLLEAANLVAKQQQQAKERLQDQINQDIDQRMLQQKQKKLILQSLTSCSIDGFQKYLQSLQNNTEQLALKKNHHSQKQFGRSKNSKDKKSIRKIIECDRNAVTQSNRRVVHTDKYGKK